MGWLKDLLKPYPKPFDPSALTVIVFGPDRQAYVAEASAALGKKASVRAVDGASGVAELLTAHGQAGKLPRCQLVFAHFIPIPGGGLAPQAKVGNWLQNWTPGRAFPDGDKGRPSVQVTRLTETNRVFVQSWWDTGVSAEILLRIARHQEAWHNEIAAHWLTH